MSFPPLAFFNDKLNDVTILIANKLLNANVDPFIKNKANQDAIQIGKKYFNCSKITNCYDALKFILKFHFDHVKH